ncbi:hypothetical protein GCM10007916_25820 [Psychromonas marina]|uniref:Pilus assembly protein FimV n=1 Tax=Psychromonas marina TaxID=88364 RepID=A0ABQ6E2V1_9GAMM|nr:FimV/HubP family polar landmark protein [Psychromonas marina]GLS91513.1 hypothetical protein GCM10007916_25820 [Psychromonas marina]
MKRLLLSLICCSPLLFSPSVSFSIDLTGPSEETSLSFEQYGPISQTETLWAVSTKLRPDNSVSVQQTLVAIYKSNPYAFYQGDINKIIPESIIKVPSLNFVQQQTNQEAIKLIERFAIKKKKVAAPVPKKSQVSPVTAKPLPVEKEVTQTAKTVSAVEPTEKQLNSESQLVADQQLIELQAEMDLLNEQYIVATEATQILKLKLQPLNDQISRLSEQLDAEIATQAQLQQIIDDYRAQLDSVEPAPFSGEGTLNKILQAITASLTNLLIAILSPVILLLLIFVALSRIRSKREIAEQEQELAESTAILMQESGQFDVLLTDDVSEAGQEDIDFAEPELNPTSELSRNGADTLTIPDDFSENSLNEEITLDVVDLTEDDELIVAVDIDDLERESSTDDPFGVDTLTNDQSPMAAVDLDDDDPFGIDTLSDDQTLISAVDLDDGQFEPTEDDPFGIAALTDDETPTTAIDLDDEQFNPTEYDPFGIAALTEDDQFESSEDDPFGIAALVDGEQNIDLAEETSISAAEQADLDLAAQWEAQISADSEDMSTAEIDQLFDTPSLSESSTIPEQTAQLEEDSATPIAIDLDIEDDSDAFNFEQAEEVELPEIVEENDLLAQQISDVAFNEEVALPEVADIKENDFIDIETLLENNGPLDKDEPYTEFDLDLGLEEFPDVVDLQENIDIDDDENGVSAQLDLARAYLEIDDKAGAKEILMAVVEVSNGKQRTEIDKLLSRLS